MATRRVTDGSGMICQIQPHPKSSDPAGDGAGLQGLPELGLDPPRPLSISRPVTAARKPFELSEGTVRRVAACGMPQIQRGPPCSHLTRAFRRAAGDGGTRPNGGQGRNVLAKRA